jgi:hypothetical protein
MVSATPEERVRRMYQRLFSRPPRPDELAIGLQFVNAQATAGSAAPSAPAIWQYGFGRFDEKSKRVDFQPFSHWSGNAWQCGPTLPDPLGAFLNWHSGGGHPGSSPEKSVILRWTAPRDGNYAVSGTLGHDQTAGDGVRGRAVSSKTGELGSWIAFHAKTPTPVRRLALTQGEVIDFVVDCRTGDNSDSFTWAPVVREIGTKSRWDARAEFHGPPPPALSPWEEYAQVLLLTKEFVFVD